jgi:xanthine dehydrogenase accessory factor
MMDADISEEIRRIRAAEEEAALATIVLARGSVPRREGTKMLVRADGTTLGSLGGGELDAKVCQKARHVIGKGKPERMHLELTKNQMDMVCGGQMEVFIEPLLPPPTMYIFGGGHISVPLARMGKIVGFRVIVADERPEFADGKRFPEANKVVAEPFEQVFSKLKFDRSSYIIIATQGYQSDERVLDLALKTPAKYIGLVASKNKKETIFGSLQAKGVSEESLGRVHSPIGLEIAAETPEEIAVSILAELIKVLRS